MYVVSESFPVVFITPPLRNMEFYSLDELNEAVREKLEAHNNATIEKMKSMRFHGMANAFKNLLETGKNMKLTINEAISYLVNDSQTSEWRGTTCWSRSRVSAENERLKYPAACRGIDRDSGLGPGFALGY